MTNEPLHQDRATEIKTKQEDFVALMQATRFVYALYKAEGMTWFQAMDVAKGTVEIRDVLPDRL